MGYTSTQRSRQFQQRIKLDPVKYAEMKEKDKLRNREARKKKKAHRGPFFFLGGGVPNVSIKAPKIF